MALRPGGENLGHRRIAHLLRPVQGEPGGGALRPVFLHPIGRHPQDGMETVAAVGAKCRRAQGNQGLQQHIPEGRAHPRGVRRRRVVQVYNDHIRRVRPICLSRQAKTGPGLWPPRTPDIDQFCDSSAGLPRIHRDGQGLAILRPPESLSPEAGPFHSAGFRRQTVAIPFPTALDPMLPGFLPTPANQISSAHRSPRVYAPSRAVAWKTTTGFLVPCLLRGTPVGPPGRWTGTGVSR